MRVLVLFAHPVEASFQAALNELVVDRLTVGGHDVDACDLYAEGFQPCLSREERLAYHDVGDNVAPVRGHVERLKNAEALVLVYPVWNFGYPAILKGYFDRVFLPGVSFDLVDGRVKPALHNVTRLASVTTYGATRLRAFLAGDPPRKHVTRVMRALIRPGSPVRYLAHYDMNRSTVDSRAAFIGQVSHAMERF
jgi:putative NADPH-quinone reductase